MTFETNHGGNDEAGSVKRDRFSMAEYDSRIAGVQATFEAQEDFWRSEAVERARTVVGEVEAVHAGPSRARESRWSLDSLLRLTVSATTALLDEGEDLINRKRGDC